MKKINIILLIIIIISMITSIHNMFKYYENTKLFGAWLSSSLWQLNYLLLFIKNESK